MKNNYEIRAQKFIRQLMPYLLECDSFNAANIDMIRSIETAISAFNTEKHRKVNISFGSTRIAILSSDYVIKIDYNPNGEFGDSKDEIWNWEKRFSKSEFAKHFAPISKYTYNGFDFYIMPFIPHVGEYMVEDIEEDEDEDFSEWIHEQLIDLHEEQFGKIGNKFVFVDYARQNKAEEEIPQPFVASSSEGYFVIFFPFEFLHIKIQKAPIHKILT